MNPNLKRRRERLLITIDILNAATKGIVKTHLLYSVGLSFEQLTRYLNFLKANGFIEINDDLYHTTQKGMELLTEFESSPLTRSVLTI